MKLSPPASSSDLEAAREIARRLHQRRRRQDRPDPEDQASPLRSPRPSAEPPLRLAPPFRPAPATPPPVSETTPAPPAWDEPDGQPSRPVDAGDPLAGFGSDAVAEAVAMDTGEPPPEVEVDEAGVSPEVMVGSADGLPFDPLPETVDAPPSPFDVELDEDDTSPEGSFGAPAPPSWDDIVETCLGLAQASGAMLVDPSGQVFASHGEWPEPGPDAIAAKLVSTMARTLRDAPTRSISAPLMGRHLTAWRIPLTEGLVTAAFIGDAPVRAEARPGIDAEIHRGAGA